MISEASELRIPDVQTFLAVCRHGSVTGAARELRVTPSQVSKAVARLEKHLHRPLLSRNARGVTASEAGTEIVPRLEELLERVESLAAAREPLPGMKLTLAAAPHLCAAYMPIVAAAVPDARFRCLECSDAYVRAYVTENAFQIAITSGPEPLPDTWVSTPAGSMRSAVYCSPELAWKLGPAPAQEKLLAHPWVVPLHGTVVGSQLLPADDGCPLPRERRILGHEAASAGVAFELAAATHQLVFGPAFAARTAVLAGRLVEVKVQGWRLITELYVHARADLVLARVQKAIVSALRVTTADDR